MEDKLDSAELFLPAVTSLPNHLRQRLDGDGALDWTVLEDPETAIELAKTARAQLRLPEPVENLVAGLIRELGAVPSDLAAGAEREGAANAWLRHFAIEPDGECYRLRNLLSGDVHTGIRPEAVAGYAVLALNLMIAVDQTGDMWMKSGNASPPGAANGLDPLAHCAIRMNAELRSRFDSGAGPGVTGQLARILEDAWNALSPPIRAELSTSVRLSTAREASAPRRCHMAPMNSYRMHACDLGEIRWLHALAKRAGIGASLNAPVAAPRRTALHAEGPPGTAARSDPASEEQGGAAAATEPATATAPALRPGSDPGPDELLVGEELAKLQDAAERMPATRPPGREEKSVAKARPGEDAASLDMTALEAQIQAEASDALQFAHSPGELSPVDELAKLRGSATGLPGGVARRLADSCGIAFSQVLTRLADDRDTEAVNTEVSAALSSRRLPTWLEEFAAALLLDTGAETRDGVRTGRLRLDPQDGPEYGYLAIDTDSGTRGHLSLNGLLLQMHLSLAFARDAWTASETLRAAGAESAWILGEHPKAQSQIAGSERDTLEAAQQIQRGLNPISHASVGPHRSPSSLDQASGAAKAIGTVGPMVRAAAGWPGAADPPNPRDPADVAHIAAFAEDLHDLVKSISNRLIAGGVGSATSAGQGRSA